MDRIIVKADLHVDEKANTVEGIAWPYASPDKVGDIIIKGAITPAATELPMLLEHKTGQLIGLWTRIEDRADGLYVKGQFNETVLARGVRSQIITGRRNGLSIAFYTKSAKRQGKNRVITAADMVEVSVVERPSHPGAQLTQVKNLTTAHAIAGAINRATDILTTKYDDDQPRDDHGRWSSGGGGRSSGPSGSSSRSNFGRLPKDHPLAQAAMSAAQRSYSLPRALAITAGAAGLMAVVASGGARQVAFSALKKFGPKVTSLLVRGRRTNKSFDHDVAVRLLDDLTDDDVKNFADEIIARLSDEERHALFADLIASSTSADPTKLAETINRATSALQQR